MVKDYTERDKFLTETMGLEWVESTFNSDGWKDKVVEPSNLDFSTWEGFGKLFMWAGEQWWWGKFWADNGKQYQNMWSFPQHSLNPDKFPDNLYNYLKSYE